MSVLTKTPVFGLTLFGRSVTISDLLWLFNIIALIIIMANHRGDVFDKDEHKWLGLLLAYTVSFPLFIVPVLNIIPLILGIMLCLNASKFYSIRSKMDKSFQILLAVVCVISIIGFAILIMTVAVYAGVVVFINVMIGSTIKRTITTVLDIASWVQLLQTFGRIEPFLEKFVKKLKNRRE